MLTDLGPCDLQALGNRSVVAFDSEDVFPGVPDEETADDASALHAGNRVNLFEDTAVEVDPLRRDGARFASRCRLQGRRRGELHHEDPLSPEARIDIGHVPPASDEEAGADQQYDRDSKLRHHDRAMDSTGGRSARDASTALLAGQTQLAAQRCPHGSQSYEDPGEKRDAEGPDQRAAIERHFAQTRQVRGPEDTNQADTDNGDQCADDTRDRGEQHTFGQHLSHDPSGTRSKRRANSHLAKAGDAASQREAGDVGGGDQEDTEHGGADHPQCQPRLASDHVETQRGDGDVPVPCSRRQLVVEATADSAHLRLGLLERRGRSKSSDNEPPFSATNVLASRMRLPDVLIEFGELEPRRQDADDLRRKPIEHDGRADRLARACESGSPEAMADQDHAFSLLGLFGRKATSERGLDAEEREQVGGDAGAGDLFHPIRSGQRPGDGVEGGHVLEALTLTPPLFDIPESRSALAQVLCRVLGPQHRQLFRRPIWKRAQQHRIEDAEHGGVGPNRQRQHHYRSHRESGTSAESPYGEAQVLHRRLERCVRSSFPVRFPHALEGLRIGAVPHGAPWLASMVIRLPV